MKKINQQHKDLLTTLANHAWHIISGPVTLLLIPLFLSPEQQGYWYLFGSIAALKYFADLGFSNIILQFSAHEYAFLHFDDDGFLDGEKLNLLKLGSFLRFSIRWIITISALIFPIIYIIGLLFFYRDKVLSFYFLPWTIYAIGSLFNFYNISILSFVEGLDKIALIQKIKLFAGILNTFIVVFMLICNGHIYALSFGLLLSSLFILFFIIKDLRNILKQLLDITKSYTYNWRKDVIPLFVKYALTWSSGYFSAQIYIPLMHYFHGPVYSGKVGITIALVSAIFTISNIWLYTIIPKINMYISKNIRRKLDILFKKRLMLSLMTYIAIIIGLYIFISLFGKLWLIPKIIVRFMPIQSLIILFLAYFIHLIFNFWAVYVRGHKQEPYVIPTMVSAVWVPVVTYLMGKFMPVNWFFMGLLSNNILFLPVGYMIFKRYKKA